MYAAKTVTIIMKSRPWFTVFNHGGWFDAIV